MEINKQVENPKFWDDNALASSTLKEKKSIEDKLTSYKLAFESLKNLHEMYDFLQNQNDLSLIDELDKQVKKDLKNSELLKIQVKFVDEIDKSGCYLEIHSGAGGTEACDWANMIKDMYINFANKRGFKLEIVDELDGDVAGIKSATLQIDGMYAYGWLKNESGVHRLVRISPFDSTGKRHTSFASVWVYPIVDDSINIEINEKDLRIDTYRASGAGGQHINKTDSAVRITHIPTNTIVQCQSERSQHKNKDMAMKMLKSKLYELQLQEKQAELDKQNATKNKIEWGSQIRSYVMQPYTKVKDLRTDIETPDVDSVLAGDLEVFIN